MIDGRAPVEVFDEIDSTVLEARRRAESGAFGPGWLIARTQTAGRGRRGRQWTSLEGNLFATYFGPSHAEPAAIALMGFATALAISDAVESFVGEARTTLKWPNDVLLDGAKCAGILIESGGAWFSLSFGVNLAASPKSLDQPTTSIAEANAEAAPTPLEFFAPLRRGLEAWIARLAADGFAPVRDAWLARAHGLGAQARVVLGAETVHGRLAGLSERGELELDTDAGRRMIAAGDVLLAAV